MKKILLALIPLSIVAATITFYLWNIGVFSPPRSSDEPTMPQQEALKIAQNSPELKAFLAMGNGRFATCLSTRVVKPCDSDWVTCIDDAWVVEFLPRAECGIGHDGRLSLRLLVDKDGKIISRFPEKEYFQDSGYCIEKYDCMAVIKNEELACLNFVYGQLEERGAKTEQSCGCVNQRCVKEIPR